jgi:hypothetical protein
MGFGIDWSSLLQAILFALFADLTAIVAAIIGPTYDNLLVPALSPGALYPTLVGTGANPANYLTQAAHFSSFVLADVVDPSATLFALAVAVAYLSKAVVARWAQALDGLLPRLVVAIIAANFTVPITGAVLSLGGALYPVLAGWDGGTWQHWANLAGWGEIAFSWDNGALAFILSLVEFGLVFALVLAVAVRDALLAVLIVVLPLLTLFWPLRPFSPLARRAWLLFGELVFLPCVLVIPLELAVASPTPVLLVGYLGAALASPYLLSLAGTHLVAFGVPGAGGTVQSGATRGVSSAPAAATAHVQPVAAAGRSAGPSGRAISGAVRVAGSAAAPTAAPFAAAELLGHGALHLLRHLPRSAERGTGPGGWGPIRGGRSR